MERLLDERTTEQLRNALQALRKGAAEVEAVVYAEKCASLPRLSLQDRITIFSDLYEMGRIFRCHPGPIPEREALHIEETVAIRKAFNRIAGHRPAG